MSLDAWNADFRLVLSDLPMPGEWARAGRCRDAPASLFFPQRGEDVSQAVAICERCPVLEQCRAYAIAAPQDLKGIWGGLTGRQRRALHGQYVTKQKAAHAAVATPARTKRAWRGSMYRQLETLVAQPGRWARIARYPAASSAGSMASVLRNGQRTLPPGEWKFEGRLNEEGGSDLYASYLGADGVDEEWASA